MSELTPEKLRGTANALRNTTLYDTETIGRMKAWVRLLADDVDAAASAWKADRAHIEALEKLLAEDRGCGECWHGVSCGADCHMNDVAALAAKENA